MRLSLLLAALWAASALAQQPTQGLAPDPSGSEEPTPPAIDPAEATGLTQLPEGAHAARMRGVPEDVVKEHVSIAAAGRWPEALRALASAEAPAQPEQPSAVEVEPEALAEPTTEREAAERAVAAILAARGAARGRGEEAP